MQTVQVVSREDLAGARHPLLQFPWRRAVRHLRAARAVRSPQHGDLIRSLSERQMHVLRLTVHWGRQRLGV